MTLDKVKLKTVNNQSLIGEGNITAGGADIVTSWNATTSDSKVPSEKLVKNSLDSKPDSSDIPTKTSELTNDGDGTNVFVKNNDSRLTDNRTPTSHTHGNLTNDGKVGSTANYFVYTTTSGAITSKQKIGNITTSGAIGSTSGLPVITTTSGVLTTGSFGTSSGTFAEGNHSHSGYLSGTKVTSWSGTVSDSNVPSEKLVKNSLDGKADSSDIPTKTSDITNDGDGTNVFVKNNDSRLSDARTPTSHTHTKSQITDFPTSMTPTSHTHGNLQNDGQVGSTAQASKNVVTDSNGKITTEDKPTIPSASSTTPSADTSSGSYGSGTTYARSNHTHPKSSLYAEATHSHTKSQISDFPTLHTVATSGSYNDLLNKPVVDTNLNGNSNNAVANSAVVGGLNDKLEASDISFGFDANTKEIYIELN